MANMRSGMRRPCGSATQARGALRRRWAVLLLGLALLAGWPAGAAPARQQLKGHLTAVMSAPKASGELPATTAMRLSIGLAVTDPAGLAEFLRNISTPGNPLYRKYLTPEQFTARFTPSAADYQALADWARSKKLEVVKTHADRLLLDVSGSAGDVEAAFGVKLVQAQRADGSPFFRPDREPSLDFKIPVQGVTGLDNFDRPRSHGFGSSPIGNYISSDLRKAYVPGTTLTGAGQAVGILAYDGYKPSDVATYQAQAGLPALVPGNDLAPDVTSIAPSGTSAETVGDIEFAQAMAPGLASLTVYLGTGANNCNDRDTLLADMASSSPLSLQNSSSYGCTTPGPNSGMYYGKMAAQGQSFFAASGDNGGYPSNQQAFGTVQVTMVGGTILSTNGPGGAYVSETTWDDPANQLASGGGVEYMIPIPVWQQGTTFNPASGASTTSRNDPDVAMVAQGLYIVSTAPNANGFEGTSASSPLWAGFMALVNQESQRNNLPPVNASTSIWNIGRSSAYGNAFNDITTGTATSYIGGVSHPAATGYDLATGWGTPKLGLIDQMSCGGCSGTTATVSAPPMCAAFQTDNNNCGTCGNVCQGGASCVGGACQTGISMGDTHITTFDGLFYDFQAWGDYLLASTGPSFIVQTRQQQGLPNWPSAATNHAVAMLIGGHRLAFFLPQTRLLVDGAATQVADGQSLALGNGVSVSRNGNLYLVARSGGESVQVDMESSWINVNVGLGPVPGGKVRGLLGNANGLRDDDLMVDGRVLAQPLPFLQLYGAYAESLRVAPRESLFGDEAAPGAGVPARPFYAADLGRDQAGPARQACVAAGVTAQALLEACTLDVVVIGDPAAANAFVKQAPPLTVMKPVFQAPPPPPPPAGPGWRLWLLLALLLALLLWWWVQRKV